MPLPLVVRAGTEAEVAAAEAAIKIVNLGTDWSAGESQPIYVGKDAAGANLEIKRGTAAAPDEVFKSPVRVSRTLTLAESAFSGDGQIGLGAITGVTKALSTSEAQALGVVGGAVTESSIVGTHSQGDAFGGYFVGRSTSGSTRTGGGLFLLGQRNNNGGKATGAEITIENNAAAGTHVNNGYGNTMCLWVTPRGEADSGSGIVFGHPTERKFEVGIGFNETAIKTASLRDDSSSLRSVLIKGAHEKAAVAVASAAGSVVVGAEEVTVASTLLDVYFGESALTPGVVFGTDKAKNVSLRAIRNSTGEMNLFAANTANNFMTGTAQGDTGASFSPGKIFHIGAVGKTSQFRLNEAGMGFYGTAPVARTAAYTQTFSGTTRTHAKGELPTNITATLITELNTQLNATNEAVNELKKFTNQVVDDFQANGMFQ